MKWNRRFGGLAFTTVVFILASAGRPGALDGDIVYTQGRVVVHRNPQTVPAEIGMPVGAGDIVETAGDGMAVISLADGAELKLRANTTLALDILGQQAAVRLSAGSVFSRVNRGLISGFSVRTETAVMSVRGTEFFVAYGRKIDSHPDIWVCVNEGAVEVSIPRTQGALLVEEGKGINIVGGTNLTTPQRYPWTRKLNWNMDPTAGQVVDRTNLDQAYADLLDQDYD